MNVIDINTWRDYVHQQLDAHKTVYASAIGLAASIFKSKKTPAVSLATWNENIFQAKSTFAKLSDDKQKELMNNLVIKIPFEFDKGVSILEVLRLIDNSGGVTHITGFLSCVRQVFPVYKDVPTHIKIVSNYFKCIFQNALKSQFSDSVFIVNGTCYASGKLLLDLAVENSITHWRYINGSDMHELRISDYSSEGWNISVLEREYNDWCIFAINARRSVLKDFSLHRNCICSNIHTINEQVLNRRNTTGDQVTHLVTVFDLEKTLSSMKSRMSESETVEILSSLIV